MKINKTSILTYLTLLTIYISIFCNLKPMAKNKYQSNKLVGLIPLNINKIIEKYKKPLSERLQLANRLLLYGPPGNGKTSLAYEISKQIEAYIFEIDAQNVVEGLQGSGAKNINDSFDEAEKMSVKQKVIILLDEVDSIAYKHNIHNSNEDRKIAKQRLWKNLDKIKDNKNILVILTTNYYEDLDPVLINRFADNTIEIPNPDDTLRKEVIGFYSDKISLKLTESQSTDLIKKTKGLSCRQIEEIVYAMKDNAKDLNKNILTKTIYDPIIKTHKSQPKLEKHEHINKRTILENTNLVSSTFYQLTGMPIIWTLGIFGLGVKWLHSYIDSLSEDSNIKKLYFGTGRSIQELNKLVREHYIATGTTISLGSLLVWYKIRK